MLFVVKFISNYRRGRSVFVFIMGEGVWRRGRNSLIQG